MKTTTKVWVVAIAYWLCISVLACWLYPVTIFDPCSRYAIMADAFARGDFYYAFHPRFGVLFQVLTGTLSILTGLDGIYCLQPIAFLMLALSGVLMFAVTRRLTDSEEVAWWTLAIVLLEPDFFRYALDGLRDPGKCLVFALIAYAVVHRSSAFFAIGIFVYVSLYAYGFAASAALLFLWALYFAWRGEWRKLCLPIVGFSVGTLAVTVMNHAYTGHWLPAPQLAGILGRWL